MDFWCSGTSGPLVGRRGLFDYCKFYSWRANQIITKGAQILDFVVVGVSKIPPVSTKYHDGDMVFKEHAGSGWASFCL